MVDPHSTAVTSATTWPLLASCERCGESRARRPFATCATCGSPNVQYRPAATPARSAAPVYRPLFVPGQRVWFLRSGKIVEASVVNIDSPQTGLVGLYVASESYPGCRSCPSIHNSRLFARRENAEEAQDAFHARPVSPAEAILNRPTEPDFKDIASGRHDAYEVTTDLAAGRT